MRFEVEREKFLNKVVIWSNLSIRKNRTGHRGFDFQRVNKPTEAVSGKVFATVLYCCLVTESCPAVCDPMDCSPPGSSVHGILQESVLEWVARPSSRGSSHSTDQTYSSCFGEWILHHWATWEALFCIINIRIFQWYIGIVQVSRR